MRLVYLVSSNGIYCEVLTNSFNVPLIPPNPFFSSLREAAKKIFFLMALPFSNLPVFLPSSFRAIFLLFLSPSVPLYLTFPLPTISPSLSFSTPPPSLSVSPLRCKMFSLSALFKDVLSRFRQKNNIRIECSELHKKEGKGEGDSSFKILGSM